MFCKQPHPSLGALSQRLNHPSELKEHALHSYITQWKNYASQAWWLTKVAWYFCSTRTDVVKSHTPNNIQNLSFLLTKAHEA